MQPHQRFIVRNPLGLLRDEVDQLFGDLLNSSFVPLSRSPYASHQFPAVNVAETDDSFIVETEVPGLSADKLECVVVGAELTIRGERPAPSIAEATVHRRERSSGRFSRVIHLPAELDANKVEASLKNGVLTLTLAKSEAAKPRRISITNS